MRVKISELKVGDVLSCGSEVEALRTPEEQRCFLGRTTHWIVILRRQVGSEVTVAPGDVEVEVVDRAAG